MNRWDFPDLGVGLSVDERLLRQALEDPGSRVVASHAGIPEQEFLARLADAADCPLVLDLESLCRNARRQGSDPSEYLAALPRERIVELHIGRPPRLAGAEPEAGE